MTQKLAQKRILPSQLITISDKKLTPVCRLSLTEIKLIETVAIAIARTTKFPPQ